MVEKRDFGLSCHKYNEKIVFFIETMDGPFIYLINSGIGLNQFMKQFPDLQEDRFMPLGPEEARTCQLALEKLSHIV